MVKAETSWTDDRSAYAEHRIGRRLLGLSQQHGASRISLQPDESFSRNSSNGTRPTCLEPEPERVECELGPLVQSADWRSSTWRLVWVAVDNPQLFADPPAPTPLRPNTLGRISQQPYLMVSNVCDKRHSQVSETTQGFGCFHGWPAELACGCTTCLRSPICWYSAELGCDFTIMYVGVCGCMWVYVGVCGCMWVYVGVCGCMWEYVGVCGCMWVYVCGCMWVYTCQQGPIHAMTDGRGALRAYGMQHR